MKEEREKTNERDDDKTSINGRGRIDWVVLRWELIVLGGYMDRLTGTEAVWMVQPRGRYLRT